GGRPGPVRGDGDGAGASARRPVRPRLDAPERQGRAVPAVPGHRRLGGRTRDLIIDTAASGEHTRGSTPRDCPRQGGKRMRKAIAAALVLLAMTVVAAGAQGGRKGAPGSTAGHSLSKTVTLPFVTPVTGGAGFLGTEQVSWARYAVKSLAPKLGLNVKLVVGDTPVEQGPAPAQVLAQKYVGDPSVLVLLGPSTS